jgi:hypothetical protein
MSGTIPPLLHMSSTQVSEELRAKRTAPLLPKQYALETKFVEGSSRLLTFCCIFVRNTLVAGIES